MIDAFRKPNGPQNESGHSPSGDLASNLQHVAADVTEMVELQTDLFAVDARDTLRTLAIPFVLLTVGAVVVASSALLAFTGIALWLNQIESWSPTSAFLVVAAGAVLLGLGCIALAAGLVRWCGIPLMRSFRELRLNLAWIRRALLGSGHRRRAASN